MTIGMLMWDRMPHPTQVCLSVSASGGRSSILEMATTSRFSMIFSYDHGLIERGNSTPTGARGT